MGTKKLKNKSETGVSFVTLSISISISKCQGRILFKVFFVLKSPSGQHSGFRGLIYTLQSIEGWGREGRGRG